MRAKSLLEVAKALFSRTVVPSRRAALVLFLLLALAAAPAFSQQKPALVVVISVDQMRSDYLDRFRPWLGKDGFGRFLARGARFPEARHRHASTLTCPGHTAIGTGHDPSVTGSIANDWYDVAAGRRVYCVEDRGAQWVGAPADAPKVPDHPASPNLITGEFVGDRLKEKFPRARVVSLSLKDRAAVPMGGRKADAAVWFVRAFRRFVTSTYYPPRPSLLAFNETLPAFFAKRKAWPLSGLVPEKDLARATFDPPELVGLKGPLPGTGDWFPHALPDVRSVVESPYGDELVLAFARHAVRDFRLGRNPAGAPDLLFLGLSSLDYYGHAFGADSREVADGFLRLDREIESFFAWLDREVGARRVLLFLTADHGATSMPEIARARGGSGGRMNYPNAGTADRVSGMSPDRLALERHLASRLGYALDESQASGQEAAILRFEDPIGMYVNRAVLARRRISVERVKEETRDWLRRRPEVAAAYTNTEVADGLAPTDPLAVPAARSFRADRSPDVLVYLKPGWIFRGARGSTHGQPTDADSKVPLLAWGPGVRAGSWDLRVSPLSIAKTIGTLFGFEAGAADVEVLEPVLGRDEKTRRLASP